MKKSIDAKLREAGYQVEASPMTEGDIGYFVTLCELDEYGMRTLWKPLAPFYNVMRKNPAYKYEFRARHESALVRAVAQ